MIRHLFDMYPTSVISVIDPLYDLCVYRIRVSSFPPDIVLSLRVLIILMETSPSAFTAQSLAQFPTFLLPFLISDKPSLSQPAYELLSDIIQDQQSKHALNGIAHIYSSFASIFTPFISSLPSLSISDIISQCARNQPFSKTPTSPYLNSSHSSLSIEAHMNTPGGIVLLARAFLRILAVFVRNAADGVASALESIARIAVQCVCLEDTLVRYEVMSGCESLP